MKNMLFICITLFYSCKNKSKLEYDPNVLTSTTIDSLTSVPKPKQPECIKVLQNKEIHGTKIYFDNFETGTGGTYTENGKWYLITASHVFPKGRTGNYSTLVDKDTFYVERTIFNTDDAVIMGLSTTKNRFEGFSSYKNDGSQKSGWTTEMMFKQVGGQKIFSLCGTEYSHIGYLVNEPDFIYAGLILRKHSVPGESGTVYYDENGNIYIISQQYFAGTNESYTKNEIKENEQMSLLRPVGFGIKINEAGVKTVVSW